MDAKKRLKEFFMAVSTRVENDTTDADPKVLFFSLPFHTKTSPRDVMRCLFFSHKTGLLPLGRLDDAVGARAGGKLFDVSEKNSDFVDTVLAKAIDTYVEKRQKGGRVVSVADGANHQMMMEDDDAAIDPRLESIVDKMFAKCHDEKQWAHAVGVALESKRND